MTLQLQSFSNYDQDSAIVVLYNNVALCRCLVVQSYGQKSRNHNPSSKLTPSVISWLVGFMVINFTFNNISVIFWRSVLLMEETQYQGKTTDLPQVTDKVYHIMVYTSPWAGFELSTSVVIVTDCTCSCKSNYHTITATTRPPLLLSLVSLYYKLQYNIQYNTNE